MTTWQPTGYEVIRELKRGGMGEVLLARKVGPHDFERRVAIKTIRADLSEHPTLRAMFLDEARLMGRLDHPNIAQVHDFGEHEGVLYLVLEYVAGVSFRTLMAQSPPPAICVVAIIEVLRGLHAAHELRDPDSGEPLAVVHRDISPSNLMITVDGHVKIIDFGIAKTKARQSPQTELGTIKGKPAYMAPEQLLSESVDRRADIFAAANILYEMLTGERAIAGDTAVAIALALERNTPIARASSLRDHELGDGLDDALSQALAREPDERFASARAFGQALEATIAGRRESLEMWAQNHLTAPHPGLGRGSLDAKGRDASEVTESAVLPTTALETAPAQMINTPPAVTRPRAVPLALVGLAALAIVVALSLWPRSEPGGQPAASESGPGGDGQGHTAVSASSVAVTSASASASVAAGMHAAASASASLPSLQTTASTRSRAATATRPRAEASTAPSGSAPAAASATVAYGTLTIGATPYALVTLDGVPIGPTPITRRVVVGPHTVIFTSPETGAARASRQVTVKADQTASVVIR